MRSARQSWPRPPGGLAFLLAAASGCTPLTELARCEAGKCGVGQACDQATQLCVNVRPEVTIKSPLPDAGIDAGLVRVAGKVGLFDDAGLLGLSALLPDGGRQELTLDGGAFDALVPVPIADEQTYAIVVSAVDTADREGSASVQVVLDQVGPTGVLVPGNAARSAAPVVRVVFDGGHFGAGASAPIQLTPAGGTGRFVSDSTYEIAGLAALTTYRAQVEAGAAVDAFGNLSRALDAVVFTTGAHPPSSPTVLNAGQVLDVDAVSDEDGVVTVVAQIDGGSVSLYAWGTFDGQTGDFALLDQASDGTAEVFQAVGSATADAGVPTLRTTGYFKGSLSSSALRSAAWRAGETLGSQSTGALALLATGPSCLESAGADPVGLVVAGSPQSYLRAPASFPLPVPILPARLGLRSADSWELVSATFGALDRVVFRPVCPSVGGSPFVAHSGFRSGVRLPPRLSIALPELDRSLYVYDGTDGTRVELCEACVGSASDAGCPERVERTARAGLTVASRREGGRVLGAALSGGLVELLERDLAPGCGTAWTSLGVLPGSMGAIRWVPVLFGSRPGAVYATPTQVRAEVVP